MMLATRVRDLNESATLKLNALVNQMRAQGKAVLNMTAGEPDFPPSAVVKQAVIDAVNKNLSKYTPTPGIPELRELVAAKTNKQQPSIKTPWKADDVVVANGGKQAICDAILCLIDRGDEVIIPAPYWLSYPEMVKAAEGTPVAIDAPISQGFKVTPSQLEKSINQRTKLFIINSPSNPTGAMYSKDEMVALGEVLKRYPHVWVLSDEIYDRIEFTPGSFCSFIEACPELRDRSITVNGLSKSGAMTGWRIGWSLTPPELTKGLVALQGHLTSGICSLSQAAAVASLKEHENAFETHRLQYLHRRNLALEVLRKSAKIKVLEPAGAFYLFVDVAGALGPNQDANGFAERLLQEANVAVVSGVDFGAPTCVRLAFATDDQTIKDACTRLVQFCG
ncbi:MAG: pyridoxal phosphate-dependent aminotransferase [Bdellovibrionales bacterium]|nr:pyridoxal phosphate-dependent aminotransferase [Bdellovibrionales bacterium]